PRSGARHGRRALGGARGARVSLVPRSQSSPDRALRRDDGRLPRWPPRDQREREPGGGVDARLSPLAPRDARRRRPHRRGPGRGVLSPDHGYEVLFRRLEANPILSAQDWPYPAHSVFNPGATRLRDGTTLLLCRVEDRRGLSHLCAARSKNGRDGWVIDEEPTFPSDPEKYPEELWGVEDPRITFVEELGKYVVAYTAFSRGGPGVALATTEDFRSFQRLGLVMQPDDKDAALLPRRIDGNFALIHRPMADSGAHVWLSLSPDLS